MSGEAEIVLSIASFHATYDERFFSGRRELSTLTVPRDDTLQELALRGDVDVDGRIAFVSLVALFAFVSCIALYLTPRILGRVCAVVLGIVGVGAI